MDGFIGSSSLSPRYSRDRQNLVRYHGPFNTREPINFDNDRYSDSPRYYRESPRLYEQNRGDISPRYEPRNREELVVPRYKGNDTFQRYGNEDRLRDRGDLSPRYQKYIQDKRYERRNQQDRFHDHYTREVLQDYQVKCDQCETDKPPFWRFYCGCLYCSACKELLRVSEIPFRGYFRTAVQCNRCNSWIPEHKIKMMDKYGAEIIHSLH